VEKLNIKYMEQSPQVFREFFGYMETVKGKSANTIDGYFMDLRTFFRYFKLSKGYVPADADFNKIDILDVDIDMCAQVTLADIHLFLNYATSVLNNKNAAKSRKCSSLRSFFNYLTSRTNQLSVNPTLHLENPKLRSSLPHFLTLEQSFDLLRSIEGKHKERDYCILLLFLTCGMRLSELVGINYRDISDDGRLRLLGKGNKERIVYLNSACMEAVRRWMAVRPKDGVIDKDALFLSSRRQRISPKTVQHLVKTYLSGIGLEKGYSTHKLRHTAATLMYQEGVDVRVLKDILGHENLSTTQIYTHVSSEQMKKAASANPIGKLRQPKDDQ